MRSWRWYSKVLFALLVAAFAYWVWPTPWEYVPPPSGEQNRGVVAVRVNRFTGRTRLVAVATSGERVASPAAVAPLAPRYQICFSPQMRADTFLLDTHTGAVRQLVEDSSTHAFSWERMREPPSLAGDDDPFTKFLHEREKAEGKK